MSEFKAIETVWHGYRFRSRLEAKWAVAFESMRFDWEFEPEGFSIDGMRYLPDFLIHNVIIRDGLVDDLFVEVKGMPKNYDVDRMVMFSSKRPLYLVTHIPEYDPQNKPWYSDMFDECLDWPYPFNYTYIDRDNFGAFLGVNNDGWPQLFGADTRYLSHANDLATGYAYAAARKARFEFNDRPENLREFGMARMFVDASRNRR